MEQVRRCCAQFWRIVFIILNILFFLIGLALVAFSIYLLASNQSLSVLTGNEIASGGALILVAGVVTCIISFVGILGAAGKWPIVLGFYIALMVIIIILEVTAAILGFVFRDQLSDFIGVRFDDAIRSYSVEDDGGPAGVNRVVDFFQSTFDCCGFNTFDDWLDTEFFNESQVYPGSCNCSANTSTAECIAAPEVDQFIWASGCNETLRRLLDSQAALISIGVVSVVIGLVELFGLGVAIGLCICFCLIRREDKDYQKPI